jgi:DNA repair protein RadA/Sms
MARARIQYVCQNCGAVTHRWQGKCESCGEWNSVIEEAVGGQTGKVPGVSAVRGRVIDLEPLRGTVEEAPRMPCGIGELDRVTGGGFVTGSALLIGGEPGIGKSTLLLQACATLARKGRRVVYISGEEATAQVRMRAERLGLADAPVALAAETSVEDIVSTLSAGPRPDFVVLDSVQTLWTSAAESSPGTVTQVRAAAQAMIRYAKQTGAAICLVGHVTKDGQIAGPRTVEHMVDAVLTFEGEDGHQFRILRASKNRFGPTDEIGVFEMTGGGLSEIANPSALFLSERTLRTPGSAVFAGMEGTRPLLCEIQALVAPSALGTPRRSVVGWDSARLAMVIAVLEARCGVRFANADIYLNVAGGLRISEPAADIAVAAALVSALTGRALSGESVFFGEISLSGALRPVGQPAARLREAARLGFRRAVLPAASAAAGDCGLSTLSPLADLTALVAGIAASDDEG